MSLTLLAQFAATTNNSKPASKAVHMLTLEEARTHVVIKDGNKKPVEGSQALTLVLGKYVLGLDAIAPKATRINAPEDKVEEFTGLLQAAIDDGTLDESIVAAQAKAKATAEKPKVYGAGASAKVDLDALDAAVEGEGEVAVEGEPVDLSDDELG